MATREIKDAKDLTTNELIYFKSHAKATYMSDGTTVEDAINNIEVTGGAVTESTVSGWGFTKNTGTYSKPSVGIPKTDLASDVQTSLGKADTALQSYTEQYKGTVTGVKINGNTKNPSNGVVDLGTVITSHQDISGKQDKLVSGTNIKTINGESILGSGDIMIEGGSSGVGGKECVEAPTLFEPAGAVICFNSHFKLEPNKVYVVTNEEVSNFELSYDAVDTTDSLCDEYSIMFKTGSDGVAIIVPEGWIVSNNSKSFIGYVEISIVRTTYQDSNLFKVVIASFEQS